MKRWLGLRSLVQDGVEHASRAIEQIQKQTAARTFDVLEQIPSLAAPTRTVRTLHDLSVSAVHGSIRLVTRTVGGAVGLALEVAGGESR